MTNNEGVMDGVAAGTLFIFIGNAVGMGLGFLARISIARLTDPSSYGLIILGVTALNSLTIFAVLGLEKGVARNIAVSDEPNRLVSSSVQSIIGVSILLSAAAGSVVYLYPGLSEEIQNVMIVFILGVPFLATLRLTKGIFQGTEDTIAKILSQDLARRIFVIMFAVAGVIIGSGVTSIAIGWVLGIALAALVGVTLVVSRSSSVWNTRDLTKFDRATTHSLLAFSLPIMLSDSTWRLMQEIDNLLLGYLLENTSSVGIYDASYTIGKSMLIFLWTFQFLFLPIFTRFYESEETSEINRFFSTATKWLISLALPTTVVLLFYPELAIRVIFDTEYAAGKGSLMVLAFGFFLFVTTGLSRHALTAIGRTKLIFVVSVLSLLLDIVLNIVLIPIYGIQGAAMATATAFGFANLTLLTVLYYIFDIHPVSKPLLSSFAAATVTVVTLNVIIEGYVTSTSKLILGSLLTLGASILCFTLVGVTDQDQRFLNDIVERN